MDNKLDNKADSDKKSEQKHLVPGAVISHEELIRRSSLPTPIVDSSGTGTPTERPLLRRKAATAADIKLTEAMMDKNHFEKEIQRGRISDPGGKPERRRRQSGTTTKDDDQENDDGKGAKRKKVDFRGGKKGGVKREAESDDEAPALGRPPKKKAQLSQELDSARGKQAKSGNRIDRSVFILLLRVSFTLLLSLVMGWTRNR